MFKHFAINTEGRDFAVGDIHGNFTILQERLDDMGFEPDRDRLFAVGDLVDRGPESEKFVEWLDKPWFHSVRGNHEQMVIDAVNDDTVEGYAVALHAKNGGMWLLGLPTVEQQCYALVCQELPLAIEVETANGLVGLVHAECPLDDWELFKSLNKDNKDYFEAIALWARTRINQGWTGLVNGLHKLYVGHTPLKRSIELGNVVYIDTGAVFNDNFTIVQIN